MQAASRLPKPHRRDVNVSCVEQKEIASGTGGAVPGAAGPCPAVLLSTPQEVREVVARLQEKGLQLSDIELNLSAHIDPAALQQLLAAVDAHAELKHLHLRVNGSDTAPIPAPLREPLAACHAFLVKGGFLARQRLFPGLRGQLPQPQWDGHCRLISQGLDAFLAAKKGYEGQGELRRDRAALLLNVALRVNDGALMHALAMLLSPRLIEIEGISPCGLSLGAVDRRLEALGLNYSLKLDIRTVHDFKQLSRWLSSPHDSCKAITVVLGSAQSLQWGGLPALLKGQAALLSVRVLSEDVGEIEWTVGRASAEGRAPTRLSIRLHPGRVDTEAMTGCMALLKPQCLTLQAEGPEGVACVLACVEHPVSVSALNVSWNRADGALDALGRQLRRFDRAVVTVRATESQWRGMHARWLSVVEAGSPWFDGFTLIEVTDGGPQRFSVPGPARAAYWVKGMQRFFAQSPRNLSEDLSLSLFHDEGGVLTLEDCRALTLVSQQAQLEAAREVRAQRAAAIAAGVQDGRIDLPMLGRLLTDASGRIDRGFRDAVFCLLPATPQGWERVEQGFTEK